MVPTCERILARLADRVTGRYQPASASISSSVRLPGTMTMGIGKEAAALPARVETRGPGPSLPLPAASTRKEMSSSSLISLMISSARSPTRIDLLGLDARGAAGLAGGGLEPLLRLVARLLDHGLADADPLEVVGRVDDGEHDHARAGAGRAPRGEMDRPGAFRASRRPPP